jgi:hypothetical protein
MVNATDKSAEEAFSTKVQAASTKLDSILAGMTGADAKVAADFRVVWDQFKATRDEEIITAIQQGKVKSERCWIFWFEVQPLKACDEDRLGLRIPDQVPS